MYTDEQIISIFFTEKGNLRRYKKILENNKELESYILQRYNDSNSINESLWRIKLHYENVPLCPICKKNRIKFYGSAQIGFSQTCSKQCRAILWKNNQIKTIQNLYGVDNVWKNEKIKQKIQESNLQKFGYAYNLASPIEREKYKKINLEKYGIENAGGSKQAIEKIKQTCLKRYGVENPWQIPEVQEKIKLYKKLHGMQVIYNGIKFDSHEECEVYKLLLTKYKNIKCQYKSELYPYYCDFYIDDIDLYIEYNGYWHHGNHLFDENNPDDINRLNILIEKSKTKKRYLNAINVWTKKDPEKYNTAINNHLNYKIFYNLKEVQFWLKNEV